MTDQKNDDLLPCPFCGHDAVYIAYGQDRHQVDCGNPEHCLACAGTPTLYTKEGAYKAWNTRAQPVADDAGGDELDVHDRLRHMTDDFKMSQHQCRHQSEQISALQVELAQAKAALRQPPAADAVWRFFDDASTDFISRAKENNKKNDIRYVMSVELVDFFKLYLKSRLGQPPAADMTASIPAADNRGVDVEATMSINAIQKAAGVLYDQLHPYMNAKSLGHAQIFMAYSTIMEQTMDLRDIIRTTPEDAKWVILGYLHEVTEPDGQYHKMYSAQEESPWKHWKEDHQAGCRYKRTALFGATQQPEHEVKE